MESIFKEHFILKRQTYENFSIEKKLIANKNIHSQKHLFSQNFKTNQVIQIREKKHKYCEGSIVFFLFRQFDK